jgi:hypothetical protein
VSRILGPDDVRVLVTEVDGEDGALVQEGSNGAALREVHA